MSKRKSNGETEHEVKKFKNDDRLLFNVVETLQNIAAMKIALALWYHQNIRNIRPSLGYNCQSFIPEKHILSETDYSNDEDFGQELYLSRHVRAVVHDCLETLDLPLAPGKEVEKYFNVIEQQIDIWKYHQCRRIFFDHNEMDVFKYLNEIIWRSSGLIDDRETAKRMLLSPNITQMEKYRIICTYCLEDEFENVSPIVFHNEYCERVVFEKHPLIHYWNLKRRWQLNEITTENFESERRRVIFSGNAYRNECAVEYLFRYLSPQEKLDEARYLIREYGHKFQCVVLRQLDEFEQREIFQSLASTIITNFAKKWYLSKHALNTWIHVKAFVSVDQCYPLWISLVKLAQNGVDGIDILLLDIWKNTPDVLKPCILTYNDHFIIEKILREWTKFFSPEFFLEMFQTTQKNLFSILDMEWNDFPILKSSAFEHNLEKLDSFLSWFFGSRENAKKYKIDQINRLHRMRTISNEKLWHDDHQFSIMMKEKLRNLNCRMSLVNF